MLNQRGKEIVECVETLNKVLRKKRKFQKEIEILQRQERELIFRLSSFYGEQPVQEKAERIQVELKRIEKMSSRMRSNNAKNRWANLSEEEKQRRKDLLAKAREKRMLNLIKT